METFFWRNLHKCTQDLKFFIGQVIVLEHKWMPWNMCDSVRQKLDHTNTFLFTLASIVIFKGGAVSGQTKK